MKAFNDNELRSLLLLYDVCEPSPELVSETKNLMRKEMVELAQAPSPQANWLLFLVGFSVMMSLSIFYMFTVGTILSFTLPSFLTDFLRHTMYALIAVGGSMLAGMLLVLCLKLFQIRTMKHAEQLM